MIAPILTRSVIHPIRERTNAYHRRVSQCLKELERSQWWSPEKLRDLQERRLREICVRSVACCKYYARMFEKEMINPGSVTLESLSRIPILEKSDIRKKFSDLISSEYDMGALSKRSSGGSTGEPVHILRNRKSFIEGRAIKLRNYAWTGWRQGDRHHWFWGAAMDAPKMSMRDRLNASIYNQVFINAFQLSDEVFIAYYEKAVSQKPILLESYSNILYEFARFIQSSGRAPLRIPAVISSAGKLFDFQRELIMKHVSENVFDRYGCRELDNIAHECGSHEGLHVSMERYIVEIESPDENGFGDILVTDLANDAFPMIRYRIQDRGKLAEESCACGRGLAMLSEIEGRSTDNIRTPDGRVISGALFPRIFRIFPEILMGQVIQRKLNEIEVLLRVQSSPGPDFTQKVTSEIAKYTGSEVGIQISIVDELIMNPTAKYRFVISEL